MQNGAEHIADIMSDILKTEESSNAQMLEKVSEYSLQLSYRQQRTIMKLWSIAHHPRCSPEKKENIIAFVEYYKRHKRYHDSLPAIGRAIHDISHTDLWPADAMRGSVVKTS